MPMLVWLSYNIGPIESTRAPGPDQSWTHQPRRHVGPEWWTQHQGRGWEIMYTPRRQEQQTRRGIYIDIDDEQLAVLFSLRWL